VANQLKIEIILSILYRCLLADDLLRVDACLSHGVLDLLERIEDGLAIGGEVGVILRLVLMQLGAVQEPVKDDLRDRRPERPDAAGPVEEAGQGRALKSAIGGDGDLREE